MAAPDLSNAEFLSKRLARVAKLAGVTMPSGTHEQIAELAGTILGEIARALETAPAAPVPVVVPGLHLVVFDELTEEGETPEPFVIDDERAAAFHREHFLKNHLEPVYRIPK